ncbi:protein kinase, partial [Klebsiella pneumoniae]|uniref:protein kinase domain-containing protein n=1 Tax=Klebsiella pneumoniae TaxID=573 RepID=UPI0038533CFE
MLCPSSEHNVLVKIIDFGIARMEADGLSKTLTKSSVILGTPAYMSPERCTGEKADQRSDIYSLACIMYQSITGEAPFSGLSP